MLNYVIFTFASFRGRVQIEAMLTIALIAGLTVCTLWTANCTIYAFYCKLNELSLTVAFSTTTTAMIITARTRTRSDWTEVFAFGTLEFKNWLCLTNHALCLGKFHHRLPVNRRFHHCYHVHIIFITGGLIQNLCWVTLSQNLSQTIVCIILDEKLSYTGVFYIESHSSHFESWWASHHL